MATSDMLRQAIADAKIIKETAIANAKNALEEAFTPKLKELLSEKIEEMDMEEEMEEGMHYEEEMHEEDAHEGKEEMHEGEKEMHEGDMEEGEDMHEGEMSEEDLEEMLKEMGYKVLLAKDGQEAVNKFKKNQTIIDLVILDMIMPVLNGRETFEMIRNIDSKCKVIISSGFTKDENLDLLMSSGLSGFIHKPYSIYEMSTIISKVMNS